MLALAGRTAHRRLRTPRELARAASSGEPAAVAIAAAIDAVRRDLLSSEERTWVERLEALRARLAASQERVRVIDYGAGESDLELGDEAMAAGRELTVVVGEICRTAAKPPRWALLLFELIRRLRPVHCVELGTSLGLSAAYQGAALELNGAGTLVSLEGAPALVELARRNLVELGLARVRVVPGRFQDTLAGVLDSEAPVDYAFVDGHHDREATLAYFERLIPAAAADAVLVFDDIAWSRGMREAWREVCSHPRVALAVDLFKVGVCALGSANGSARRYRIALD